MTRQTAPIPPGPVLAVCGWSGSGKTTVLREVIPRLVARGLSVAAVKHDAHGIRVDPRGKDSDQLFAAGADVLLRGPGQSLARSHDADSPDLFRSLAALLRRYDLVLVEGHKDTPLPKVWIQAEDGAPPPDSVTELRHVLPREDGRADSLERLVLEWLPEAWCEPPLYGGVLIGGTSERMGEPKQLLSLHGSTFVERAVESLRARTDRVVLLGGGAVPESLADVPRLPDPPGLAGPLAGLLGALRWAPDACWAVAACDQPNVTTAALDWLLSHRKPGTWAVLPRGERGPEPLLALYDPRARALLESLASGGVLAPRRLAEDARVATPELPSELRAAWRGVNTPAEYERLKEPPRE